MNVRQGTPADLPLILELGARTFFDAYKDLADREELMIHITQTFTESNFLPEFADPNTHFLIAEVDGLPIGFAQLCVGKSTECVSGESPIFLARIYLDQTEVGKGNGSALMRSCIETAESLCGRTLWLAVWEQNTRAIRFYKRWGFRFSGTYAFQYAGETVEDLVMVRSIGK